MRSNSYLSIQLHNIIMQNQLSPFLVGNDKYSILSDPDNGKVYVISDGNIAIANYSHATVILL